MLSHTMRPYIFFFCLTVHALAGVLAKYKLSRLRVFMMYARATPTVPRLSEGLRVRLHDIPLSEPTCLLLDIFRLFGMMNLYPFPLSFWYTQRTYSLFTFHSDSVSPPSEVLRLCFGFRTRTHSCVLPNSIIDPSETRALAPVYIKIKAKSFEHNKW